MVSAATFWNACAASAYLPRLKSAWPSPSSAHLAASDLGYCLPTFWNSSRAFLARASTVGNDSSASSGSSAAFAGSMTGAFAASMPTNSRSAALRDSLSKYAEIVSPSTATSAPPPMPSSNVRPCSSKNERADSTPFETPVGTTGAVPRFSAFAAALAARRAAESLRGFGTRCRSALVFFVWRHGHNSQIPRLSGRRLYTRAISSQTVQSRVSRHLEGSVGAAICVRCGRSRWVVRCCGWG